LDAKKPSFTGSSKLDERFGLTPTDLVDVKDEDDPTSPPEDFEDYWEAPTGYLRCTRQQVFSLILVAKDKSMIMIPYSLIESGSGTFNGDRFAFRFTRDELLFEAVIEGTITHMQRVADKIAGGKAEHVRANGDEIRSVTWAPVEEPKKTPEEEEE
jgi:hypothetical protein